MIFSITMIIALLIAVSIGIELRKSNQFVEKLPNLNDIEKKINNYSGYVICVDLSISNKVYKKVEKIIPIFGDIGEDVIVIEGQMVVEKNFEILNKLSMEFFPNLIYMVNGKNISGNFELNLSNPNYIDHINDFTNQWNKKV